MRAPIQAGGQMTTKDNAPVKSVVTAILSKNMQESKQIAHGSSLPLLSFVGC